jgi:hypothetical protein
MTSLTQNQENVVFHVEDLSSESPPLVLTRYLYNKEEVLVSLDISLLARRVDESMFWGYELFFSGFAEEVFDHALKIYAEFYETLNPLLGKFVRRNIAEWKKNESNPIPLGNIIRNMALRTMSLNKMACKRANIEIVSETTEYKEKPIFIQCVEQDIAQYYTLDSRRDCDNKAWKVLRTACKYAARKEAIEVFGGKYQDFDYSHVDDWLYYASFSPLWKSRIAEYGGAVCRESKKVAFDDEDKMDEFYTFYGYYPDEQPREVQDRLDQMFPRQLTWEEFCEKYAKSAAVSTSVVFKKRPAKPAATDAQ